jgi:hypothetical protein
MTESTPAAPVVEPAAPTAPLPAAPIPAPPAAATDNPWADPDKAKAEIERLRRENASNRTQAKQNAAEEARTELAQQIGKALGLVKDDEPVDPAQLTSQLTTANDEARQARLELAVYRAAGETADAAALLDSRTFLKQVAALDPSDMDGITGAITQAVTANPRLARSQSATPARMAPNPAQGTSAQPPLGLKERIAAAEKDGDVRTAMRLKAAMAIQNSN